MSTCRKRSRDEFYTPELSPPGFENLNLGCLQRIADATEAMAQPFVALLEQVERLERARHIWSEERELLHRRIAALKGVITKLKREQKA